MIYKILQLLAFSAGGMIVAMVSNVLLLSFSRSLGIRNKNDVVIRWSNESKPSLGGVSFFVVFVFAAIAYSIVFNDAPNIFQNKQYVGLFTAGSLAFLMGLGDDAYNTKPMIKLFVQILCGVLFVVTGSSIEFFHIEYLDWTLTVLWVVVVMNSLNMLDNMDGITGTTVVFILIACIVSCWIVLPFNINIWMLMLVSVLGAVIGFLTMNVHPSKLFMGDAGSQFIGLFVAFFGMKYLWNVGSAVPGEPHPSWVGLCVTVVAFTPAAVDTLTVVINRLKKRQSPMIGGKDHTTHHLVYSGMSDLKVWWVFVIIGALSCVLSVAMVNMMSLGLYSSIPLFVVFTVFVFAILYRNTLKFKAPKKK
ncbi:MAG: MraY family glycosyltransferase [Crocinitomicaceae bacterium]|nr:MraY family glycosyltransferase [Crocinitomicaceae bacterium]